ncbi:MAG: hypothetical protein ACKOOE_06775 [Micrococcales bacterium]
MKSTFAKRVLNCTLAVAVAAVAVAAPVSAANAARLKVTTLNFDFNTAGNLANDFTYYVDPGRPGTITQEATGGIGDSGTIAADLNQRTNAVIEPNANYTMGPVGAKYIFSGYMQSTGGSGYSGFGFTTLDANSTNSAVTGSAFRQTDALGVSVHGGGFIFHNGATDLNVSWGNTTDGGGIHVVKAYAGNDDLIGNSANSPDVWYKVIYSITKTSTTKFKSRVEVWPANSDGTLRTSTAAAIFEAPDLVNQTINNSSELASYISFSGLRVTKFDNFSTTVVGANIVGAPAGSVTEQPETPALANTGSNSDNLLLLASSAIATIWMGLALVGVRRKDTRN